jgi:hypothetical protein
MSTELEKAAEVLELERGEGLHRVQLLVARVEALEAEVVWARRQVFAWTTEKPTERGTYLNIERLEWGPADSEVVQVGNDGTLPADRLWVLYGRGRACEVSKCPPGYWLKLPEIPQ